jgi:hypothetical protein
MLDGFPGQRGRQANRDGVQESSELCTGEDAWYGFANWMLSHSTLSPSVPMRCWCRICRDCGLCRICRALYSQVTLRQPGLGGHFRLPGAQCGEEIGDGDNVIQ